MAVYTLALWRTRPGSADDFVTAWQGMARATKTAFPAASAVLLRDHEDAGLFISFGPWESLEHVQQWRASRAFTDGVSAIRPHLADFEPHALDVVVVVE